MSVTNETRRKPALSLGLRGYLLLLAVCLPMDWLVWTATLFREGGARPAIPLMAAASIYLVLTRPRSISRDLPKETSKILLLFTLIAFCGFSAFVLNLIFAWSYFGGSKDPVFQAATQMSLFLLVPFLLVGHVVLFQKESVRDQFLKYIPVAAAFHLGCIALEAAGILQPTRFPLSIFRLTTGDIIGDNVHRIAGLFSEPSYFGTMAAMYGLPLLLLHARSRARQWTNALLALSLIAIAFVIGARTVIPAGACGYLAFLWQSRTSAFTPLRIVAITLAAAASIFIMLSTAAFDIRESLSTTMRFGSTVTALNVAKAGYGITGLGFGQFHFMYKAAYAPDFLFLSQEAVEQTQKGAERRASTFDLFARYLVETGIVGFALFLHMLGQFAKLSRRHNSNSLAFGALMMGSALGFLLTQDPYCFPPLILGMVFILASDTSAPESPSSMEIAR